MDWFWNGLVITTDGGSKYMLQPHDRYRGTAHGKPWPLTYWQDFPDDASPEFIERVHHSIWYTDAKRTDGLPSDPVTDDRAFHPAVMTEISIVERYIGFCKTKGIETKVFLCATTSDRVRMDEALVDRLLPVASFLGYDYLYWDFGYSDLFGLTTPFPIPGNVLSMLRDRNALDSLAQYKELAGRLNNVGLFDNKEDLMAFITARWEVARATVVSDDEMGRESWMEMSGEFWPCEVRELQWPPHVSIP